MKKTNNIILSVGIIAVLTALLLLYSGFYTAKESNNQDVRENIPENTNTVTTKSVTIIAFGDSLTAGYGLPLYESYPSQLEKVLIQTKPSVRIINAGISGETTQGNFERAQFIREQNPDIVIVGIGGNDALRSLPTEETKKNIENTIKILLSGVRPPKVLLLSMQAPLNSGAQYKKEFDGISPSLAAKYSLPLVPFIVPEVSLDKRYLQNDGIHPTKEGYAILVEKYIAPAVSKIIINVE